MAAQKTKAKTKTKEWFSLVAPKLFGEHEIGKTMATDSDRLVGRRISLSLMELTGNYGKFYMKFTFKVKKIDGSNAFVDFDGSEVLHDYISRMILRRVRRIDTVQDLETSDGVKIRVKGLAIISRRIKSSIMGKIRNQIREMLKDQVTNSDFEDFVSKLMSDEIKNRVLQTTRRTYPVRNFEIRKTEIL